MSPLPCGLFDVAPGTLACVVTSLEMLARPRVLPAADGLLLRRVAHPEPDRYRRLFRAVGDPWLWTSRLLLDDDALGRIIRDPAVELWVLDHEGAEAGLVELDFREAETCELAFFGVVPALTGRGFGRRMMAHALRRAWAPPVARVWVHTCTLDHPAAVGFYVASGFVPFHRAVEVIPDPRATGPIEAGAAPHHPLL